MTRVLLAGSGAREHAIAVSLKESSDVELYAAMSSHNPGIMRLARKATVLQITSPKAVSKYAKENRVELAIIGPEAPLVNGVVDELRKIQITTVGPTRKLASLEGDKTFCRDLLSNHGISGNPFYRVFTDPDSAEHFLRTAGPVAVKPAGLTGGKGVKVSGEDLPTKEAEIAYAREILREKIGGVGKLVVEERLDGEEYSLQAFVDGRTVHVMPLVQDHKRAYEGDTGPNTGGMGSFSDRDHLLPFVSESDLEISVQIMTDVIRALKEDTAEEYRGVLYGQFMLARSSHEERPSPKLIEFNCRFGDPEAMNVLPLLSETTDFADVCMRLGEGSLGPKHVSFKEMAAVCKYLVPEDYPERATPGQVITIDETALTKRGAQAFYASVDVQDEHVVTTASRTIGIVGVGDTIEIAEKVAEEGTLCVSGPLRHRRDIGTSALIRRRVEHMRSIRTELQTGII